MSDGSSGLCVTLCLYDPLYLYEQCLAKRCNLEICEENQFGVHARSELILFPLAADAVYGAKIFNWSKIQEVHTIEAEANACSWPVISAAPACNSSETSN
jgi:hypothetical protein